MATYFLRTRTGKAVSGAGKKHAEYVSGQDKYADKNEVQAVVDKNLPKWAKDGIDFFKKADENERANGRSYRSMTIAIPCEATDKLKWAQDFTDALLKDGHAYRLAIHDKGDGNPHAHLMFCERGRNFENGDDPKDYFTRKNGKDAALKSKNWLKDAKALYLTHVQKVAPDYTWTPAKKSGQPHIGPKMKNASIDFEMSRFQRELDAKQVKETRAETLKDIGETRGIETQLATVTAEIEKLERQQAQQTTTTTNPQEAIAKPGTSPPTPTEKTPQTTEKSATESKPVTVKAATAKNPASTALDAVTNWGASKKEAPGMAHLLQTMMGSGQAGAAFAQSFAAFLSGQIEIAGRVKAIDAMYDTRRQQEEAKAEKTGGSMFRARVAALEQTGKDFNTQRRQAMAQHAQHVQRQQAQQQQPRPAAPRPSWIKDGRG
jgi:hypothetical protein